MERREAGHLWPRARREAAAEHAARASNSLGERTSYFSLSLRERVGVRVVDIDSAGARNHLQYALEIFGDIVVPEPDYAPTAGFEPRRPSAIGVIIR
jgi:hypothetical protein